MQYRATKDLVPIATCNTQTKLNLVQNHDQVKIPGHQTLPG